MRVAILHYHLRPGGVTRVIEMAESALLASGCEVLVCCGELPPRGCRVQKAAVVPELAYGVGADGANLLRQGVDRACRGAWGREADLLHVHNHSLGKNLSLPRAVADWAGEGRAMILQMHDFAENGRPENYRLLRGAFGEGLRRVLYPFGGRVRLVTLTSHAAGILRAAGAGAVVLPNPVDVPPAAHTVRASDVGGERMIVYPTRAIGRKNIAEFLLHAALARPGEVFVITSQPGEGTERMVFREWEQFARELGLPVVFNGAGQWGVGVYDFLHGADLCVTTSMEEGFGMAFLEPWMAGKGLAGRDLPDVTADFAAAGVNLENLYASLPVKLSAEQTRELIVWNSQNLENTLQAYGRAEASAQFHSEPVLNSGRVDFGCLPPAMQRQFIASPHHLPRIRLRAPTAEIIASNRSSIHSHYNRTAYGKKLAALYAEALEGSGRVEFLDTERVLDAFLSRKVPLPEFKRIQK